MAKGRPSPQEGADVVNDFINTCGPLTIKGTLSLIYKIL